MWVVTLIKGVATRGLIALLIGSLLTACTNLTEIQKYAGVSSEATTYNWLVDDYIASPKRQLRYFDSSFHSRLNKIAERRAAQKEILLTRHLAISEYLTALGRLSSNNLTNYDPEVSRLIKGAKQYKWLDATEARSYEFIAGTVLKAIAEGWRRAKLNTIIEETNDDFQTVVGGLRTIVAEDFASARDRERNAIRRYYYKFMKNQDKNDPGLVALQELMENRLRAFDEQSKAVAHYTRILDQIAEGHQKLYDSRGELSSDELIRQLKVASAQIESLYQAVKQLESKGTT